MAPRHNTEKRKEKNVNTGLKVYWLSNGDYWAKTVAQSAEEAIAFLGEYPHPEDPNPYHVFRVTNNDLEQQPGLIDSGAEGN